MLLLSSVILWVLYTRFSISLLNHSKPLCGYGLTTIAVGLGLLLTFITAWSFGYELKQDLSGDSILSIFFLGIFSTGFSVILWLRGARALGHTTAVLHQNFVPVFVILIMFILGEGFQRLRGVRGVFVILGTITVQLSKKDK